MRGRPSLAEHPLVGTACPESGGGTVLRKQPPILQIHKCSHPLLTSFLEPSLWRPETDRQTLNQGELLASVLRQRGNGELRQLLGRGRMELSVKEGFLEEDEAKHQEEGVQAKEKTVSPHLV